MSVADEPILFDAERFDAILAPWAERPTQSRGRQLQSRSDERTPHQRDRDRIIHATAFRRLRHKTQVFIAHEGDHFRTRLTHSLEVAQVARSIARALRLNEDLAEAIALAHDLGHPPFGHAGEEALNERMRPYGGFDHNVQSVRVVTELERRYLDHDGLNLTYETLEGLAKHGGATNEPHPVVRRLDLPGLLAATHHGSLEAQIAAISDDIAYNTHDIDDGLRAGLFRFGDLRSIEGVRDLVHDLQDDDPRAVFELMRRQITLLVRDVVQTTAANIERYRPSNADAVREASFPLVGSSEAMQNYDRAVRTFLWSNVYRSSRVADAMSNAKRRVGELFDCLFEEPTRMGEDWFGRCNGREHDVARTVADYIAGMTDTYALRVHESLTASNAQP